MSEVTITFPMWYATILAILLGLSVVFEGMSVYYKRKIKKLEAETVAIGKKLIEDLEASKEKSGGVS